MADKSCRNSRRFFLSFCHGVLAFMSSRTRLHKIRLETVTFSRFCFNIYNKIIRGKEINPSKPQGDKNIDSHPHSMRASANCAPKRAAGIFQTLLQRRSGTRRCSGNRVIPPIEAGNLRAFDEASGQIPFSTEVPVRVFHIVSLTILSTGMSDGTSA